MSESTTLCIFFIDLGTYREADRAHIVPSFKGEIAQLSTLIASSVGGSISYDFHFVDSRYHNRPLDVYVGERLRSIGERIGNKGFGKARDLKSRMVAIEYMVGHDVKSKSTLPVPQLPSLSGLSIQIEEKLHEPLRQWHYGQGSVWVVIATNMCKYSPPEAVIKVVPQHLQGLFTDKQQPVKLVLLDTSSLLSDSTTQAVGDGVEGMDAALRENLGGSRAIACGHLSSLDPQGARAFLQQPLEGQRELVFREDFSTRWEAVTSSYETAVQEALKLADEANEKQLGSRVLPGNGVLSAARAMPAPGLKLPGPVGLPRQLGIMSIGSGKPGPAKEHILRQMLNRRKEAAAGPLTDPNSNKGDQVISERPARSLVRDCFSKTTSRCTEVLVDPSISPQDVREEFFTRRETYLNTRLFKFLPTDYDIRFDEFKTPPDVSIFPEVIKEVGDWVQEAALKLARCDAEKLSNILYPKAPNEVVDSPAAKKLVKPPLQKNIRKYLMGKWFQDSTIKKRYPVTLERNVHRCFENIINTITLLHALALSRGDTSPRSASMVRREATLVMDTMASWQDPTAQNAGMNRQADLYLTHFRRAFPAHVEDIMSFVEKRKMIGDDDEWDLAQELSLESTGKDKKMIDRNRGAPAATNTRRDRDLEDDASGGQNAMRGTSSRARSLFQTSMAGGAVSQVVPSQALFGSQPQLGTHPGSQPPSSQPQSGVTQHSGKLQIILNQNTRLGAGWMKVKPADPSNSKAGVKHKPQVTKPKESSKVKTPNSEDRKVLGGKTRRATSFFTQDARRALHFDMFGDEQGHQAGTGPLSPPKHSLFDVAVNDLASPCDQGSGGDDDVCLADTDEKSQCPEDRFPDEVGLLEVQANLMEKMIGEADRGTSARLQDQEPTPVSEGGWLVDASRNNKALARKHVVKPSRFAPQNLLGLPGTGPGRQLQIPLHMAAVAQPVAPQLHQVDTGDQVDVSPVGNLARDQSPSSKAKPKSGNEQTSDSDESAVRGNGPTLGWGTSAGGRQQHGKLYRQLERRSNTSLDPGAGPGLKPLDTLLGNIMDGAPVKVTPGSGGSSGRQGPRGIARKDLILNLPLPTPIGLSAAFGAQRFSKSPEDCQPPNKDAAPKETLFLAVAGQGVTSKDDKAGGKGVDPVPATPKENQPANQEDTEGGKAQLEAEGAVSSKSDDVPPLGGTGGKQDKNSLPQEHDNRGHDDNVITNDNATNKSMPTSPRGHGAPCAPSTLVLPTTDNGHAQASPCQMASPAQDSHRLTRSMGQAVSFPATMFTPASANRQTSNGRPGLCNTFASMETPGCDQGDHIKGTPRQIVTRSMSTSGLHPGGCRSEGHVWQGGVQPRPLGECGLNSPGLRSMSSGGHMGASGVEGYEESQGPDMDMEDHPDGSHWEGLQEGRGGTHRLCEGSPGQSGGPMEGDPCTPSRNKRFGTSSPSGRVHTTESKPVRKTRARQAQSEVVEVPRRTRARQAQSEVVEVPRRTRARAQSEVVEVPGRTRARQAQSEVVEVPGRTRARAQSEVLPVNTPARKVNRSIEQSATRTLRPRKQTEQPSRDPPVRAKATRKTNVTSTMAAASPVGRRGSVGVLSPEHKPHTASVGSCKRKKTQKDRAGKRLRTSEGEPEVTANKHADVERDEGGACMQQSAKGQALGMKADYEDCGHGDNRGSHPVLSSAGVPGGEQGRKKGKPQASTGGGESTPGLKPTGTRRHGSRSPAGPLDEQPAGRRITRQAAAASRDHVVCKELPARSTRSKSVARSVPQASSKSRVRRNIREVEVLSPPLAPETRLRAQRGLVKGNQIESGRKGEVPESTGHTDMEGGSPGGQGASSRGTGKPKRSGRRTGPGSKSSSEPVEMVEPLGAVHAASPPPVSPKVIYVGQDMTGEKQREDQVQLAMEFRAREKARRGAAGGVGRPADKEHSGPGGPPFQQELSTHTEAFVDGSASTRSCSPDCDIQEEADADASMSPGGVEPAVSGVSRGLSRSKLAAGSLVVTSSHAPTEDQAAAMHDSHGPLDEDKKGEASSRDTAAQQTDITKKRPREDKLDSGVAHRRVKCRPEVVAPLSGSTECVENGRETDPEDDVNKVMTNDGGDVPGGSGGGRTEEGAVDADFGVNPVALGPSGESPPGLVLQDRTYDRVRQIVAEADGHACAADDVGGPGSADGVVVPQQPEVVAAGDLGIDEMVLWDDDDHAVYFEEEGTDESTGPAVLDECIASPQDGSGAAEGLLVFEKAISQPCATPAPLANRPHSSVVGAESRKTPPGGWGVLYDQTLKSLQQGDGTVSARRESWIASSFVSSPPM